MLLDRSADVYRARNISDNADLVSLKVVSGPSGSFAAFWGYCIQSKAFQLDISSLPSYGLTTMGQCEVHPLIQPDDAISALDQRLFLKQMIEYPRHMLWHPLGRCIVVAELGVLYIFNLVWLDKRTNERMGMVEAAHRIVLISTGNYATTNSMDDDMIPTEVLSVEIKQVKQLDLRVTAMSLLFPSNGLLLGTSNDTMLTLDWEGNQIPYLPTDSHDHHHEDQQKLEDQAQSTHWVDNDRAMQCLWRPSIFLLRASHGLHSQRRHHHVLSAEHLTTSRDYPATSPVPHPHPLYSSTEEVIKEIVCDNRSPQMVFVLFVDGSFSLSVQSSQASTTARSPVTSGKGGRGGDPQSSMTSSTREYEEQAEGGLQQGVNSSSSSNRVSFTCTDRIHPVALVAYPFDDKPSAPPSSSSTSSSTSGKTAEKRPSIYELARDSMMMSNNSSSFDGGDLRCSIYRSRDYVTSYDIDSLLQLTPTLRKKVCRMRRLVTGYCKEELSSVLTMTLIDDDAGPLKSTGDESPITTSTSSSSSSTTTSSTSSVYRTYPMPVRRTRLLVLMRTKHLLPTSDINDDITKQHHPHPPHHQPVYPKPTSSPTHESIIGRRPSSYSLVVLEFIAKGCAPTTSGPLLSTGEVIGKCTQSVCVGRTYSSDDDDDAAIDIADSSSSSYHLEIIRMSQCDTRGLYALLLCNGVITCRPIQSLHSILFTLDAMSCCSRVLDDAISLKMRNADYYHGLHTINVSVALSTVIVSVWSHSSHHHHHHHYYSSQQRQGDDTVKQEAISLSASSQSKVFVLSMSTALSASTAGAGSSQCEGVFVDYSKGQLNFVGPSMPTTAAVCGMGDDGSSAYFSVESDDTTGTAGISDDCYRLQLRLPARLRVDVSWYQQQCSSVSSALLQQQQWRGIRRPSLRYCTYCRAQFVE